MKHPFGWLTDRFFPLPDDDVEDEVVKQEMKERLGRGADSLTEESGLIKAAERRFNRPFEIIDRVERRATALQGTLPLAATFAIAGGALVIDGTKVCGGAWRTVLVGTVAYLVTALVVATFFSLLATTRRHPRAYPDLDAVFMFSKEDASGAWRNYALELLTCTAINDRIVKWKVARSQTASLFVQFALLGVLLLALLLVAYVIDDPTCPAAGVPAR